RLLGGRAAVRSGQQGQMRAEWFGDRLQELREAAARTREQLAEVAGLKAGGIRDIEQGRRCPGWDTVLAIWRALAVTPDAFIQAPAPRLRRGPGRPPKQARPEPPKRGRPRRAKGGGP